MRLDGGQNLAPVRLSRLRLFEDDLLGVLIRRKALGRLRGGGGGRRLCWESSAKENEKGSRCFLNGDQTEAEETEHDPDRQ